MPVYTDETSHNAYGIKETCYSVYVFINPCKAFSAQPQTSPASTYSQALLHPSQGIKYPSVVAINIHPGSSISSQFWFSLLFVIRPQALCGVSLCILAEKTPWEGICGLGSLGWKEQLSIGASNLPLSDLTHALRCDRVLQTGCSLGMCTAEATAREPGAERPGATTRTARGGHRISSGRRSQQSGASWSRGLGVQASPEANSFNSTGKSSSYCWNYHIVSHTVSLTCTHKLKLTQRHACTLSAHS